MSEDNNIKEEMKLPNPIVFNTNVPIWFFVIVFLSVVGIFLITIVLSIGTGFGLTMHRVLTTPEKTPAIIENIEKTAKE